MNEIFKILLILGLVCLGIPQKSNAAESSVCQNILIGAAIGAGVGAVIGLVMYLAKEKPPEEQKEKPIEEPQREQSKRGDNIFNSSYHHTNRISLNNIKRSDHPLPIASSAPTAGRY